jgi:purine-cytosine permease-like protein
MFFNCGAVSILLMGVVVVVVVVVGEKVFMFFGKKEEYTIFLVFIFDRWLLNMIMKGETYFICEKL